MAGRAYAFDQKKARDKIVELNKQALLSYEAKDWETARDLLTKALKEAKQAGLEDDKMTARTYLHLGAVYFVGFQDPAVAAQNFTLAKKIRPDIQLTPSIETPELKSAFDQAAADTEPAPTPEPARPQPAAPEPAPSLAGGSEPDLPSSMAAPLMCSTPEDAPPGKELSIRCALKPGISAKLVQIHYRAPGAEAFQSLPMRRSPKGWYLATLPGSAMRGTSIQVFYDARDGNDNELASNGQEDNPSVIEVRKRGGGAGAVAVGGGGEADPLAGIKARQAMEKYEAGLHRRREGAVWFGFGVGTGWGWAPKGDLEWAKDDHGKPISVGAVASPAGTVTFLPEIGWMMGENFSLSLQARFEWINQGQGPGPIRTGEPSTGAVAGFARGLWHFDLSSSGNFQFVAGPSVGGGYIRFPVKPQILGYEQDPNDPTNPQQVPDPNKTLSKTDTRPVGVVFLGASGAFVVHLSRYFALALDLRALGGFPNVGFVVEGALGIQLAFGGKSGPAPESEEGEGEPGSVQEDAPTSDAPPASDSEE